MHSCRGTVRSSKDEAKTETLHALAAALPGKLELHEADLLQDGSFDSVVKGAHFVFHCASPFVRTVDNPQKDLVRPLLPEVSSQTNVRQCPSFPEKGQ